MISRDATASLMLASTVLLVGVWNVEGLEPGARQSWGFCCSFCSC